MMPGITPKENSKILGPILFAACLNYLKVGQRHLYNSYFYVLKYKVGCY